MICHQTGKSSKIARDFHVETTEIKGLDEAPRNLQHPDPRPPTTLGCFNLCGDVTKKAIEVKDVCFVSWVFTISIRNNGFLSLFLVLIWAYVQLTWKMVHVFFYLNKQHGKPGKSCGSMSTPSAKYESSSEPQPLEEPKLDLCPALNHWSQAELIAVKNQNARVFQNLWYCHAKMLPWYEHHPARAIVESLRWSRKTTLATTWTYRTNGTGKKWGDTTPWLLTTVSFLVSYIWWY